MPLPLTNPVRIYRLFHLEGAAEAFYNTLPKSTAPIIIPQENREDYVRGFPPRSQGFKVIWTKTEGFEK